MKIWVMTSIILPLASQGHKFILHQRNQHLGATIYPANSFDGVYISLPIYPLYIGKLERSQNILYTISTLAIFDEMGKATP